LYLLVVFLMIVVSVFRLRIGEVGGLFDFLPYYAGLLFGPVLQNVLGYFGAVLILLFIVFGVVWIYGGVRGHNPHEKLTLHFGAAARRWWMEKLTVFLKAGLPTILVFFFVGLMMSYLNVINMEALRDNELLEWDRFLFGDYPFLALYEVSYPFWMVWSIAQSFSYLPFGFFILFFVALYRDSKLFVKMAVTFSLAMVASVPLWHLFPVMSPHDRYIDNVYELPIAEDIAVRLESFSPQPELQRYLDLAREKKNNRLQEHYPTSTFPSAHVAWGVLFIYFSALLDRRLLWVTVPVGVLSSVGTFFLAQHYVVDVPAGVVVALVAIWIVNRLFPEN